MVELEFETNGKKYLIKRGLRPAKFEIYVDGKMNDQMASARDSQDFLERYVLRMNEKAFRQIVVLGSGSFIPFMRLGAGDRRAIIEDLLDIQIFSLMNDIVKQRISDNGVNLVEVEHKIELLEQSIKLQEEHLKEIQDSNEEAIKEKKKEWAEAKKQIKVLKKEIDDLQGKIQDYKSKQSKHRKLGDYKSKITSKQNNIKGQIKTTPVQASLVIPGTLSRPKTFAGIGTTKLNKLKLSKIMTYRQIWIPLKMFIINVLLRFEVGDTFCIAE
jgi:DNA repair exonuclease SbcCD ATPase subunit